MKTNINSLFKCSRCELNFLSKEGMEKHHLRVHEGKGVTMTRFKCDKCDAEFDTKQDFKKHKVPQKFPCEGCKKKGQIFFAENKCEFTKHLTFFDFHKTDDVKNRNIITCTKCKLELKNSQLLKIHRQHTGKLTCKKSNCGKIFFGTCKLERHMKFDQHRAQTSSSTKPNSTPIIKPAVINLEKLQSNSGVVKTYADKTIVSKPSKISTILPKPKANEEYAQSKQKEVKPEKEDVSLMEASQLIQKQVQKHESKMKMMTDVIQFHYPTYTEQELQAQGVFDEVSATYFLPPFISKQKDALIVDENPAKSDEIPPDTFEGVCIFGF